MSFTEASDVTAPAPSGDIAVPRGRGLAALLFRFVGVGVSTRLLSCTICSCELLDTASASPVPERWPLPGTFAGLSVTCSAEDGGSEGVLVDRVRRGETNGSALCCGWEGGSASWTRNASSLEMFEGLIVEASCDSLCGRA